MFLVTMALAAVGVVGVAGTAQASMQPALCLGYSACIQAGYTDHGYGASNGTSYWREFTGDNCTNYAAYMEVQNNFSTQSQYNPGNASNWGSYFSSYSNSTPAVGSIAWWGTPHMGASMSESRCRAVRAIPSSGAASFASSKNIS